MYQAIDQRVKEWRDSDYLHDTYPAIGEILDYARLEDGSLRFLRKTQFQALETYWYLRLVLNTPTIPALYEHLFPKTAERLNAMGISPKLFEEADYDLDALIDR